MSYCLIIIFQFSIIITHLKRLNNYPIAKISKTIKRLNTTFTITKILVYFSWYRVKSLIHSLSLSVILHIAGNNAATERAANNTIATKDNTTTIPTSPSEQTPLYILDTKINKKVNNSN